MIIITTKIKWPENFVPVDYRSKTSGCFMMDESSFGNEPDSGHDPLSLKKMLMIFMVKKASKIGRYSPTALLLSVQHQAVMATFTVIGASFGTSGLASGVFFSAGGTSCQNFGR
jgi:hypothetical protein